MLDQYPSKGMKIENDLFVIAGAGVICDSNRAKKARYPSVVGCTKGEQRYPPGSDFFATF